MGDPRAARGGVQRRRRDAFVDIYEQDATLLLPPDGEPAHGREAIRRGSAAPLRPQAQGEDRGRRQGALDVVGTAPESETVELSGRGSIVFRRQADGTSRIVLDTPVRPA
jgi:ketosteroid isomerase-like protein